MEILRSQEKIDKLNLETAKLKTDMLDLGRLADGFGHTLVRSLSGAITEGRKLSDVVKSIGMSLATKALSSSLQPLSGLVGGILGKVFAHAKGGVINNAKVQPFSSGGIVNSPTLFPLSGGTGLMGEAGPEAILPLVRGKNGRLGVSGAGGNGPVVNITISTPDAGSFKQSQSQIASAIARAVARGQRNL